MRKMLPSALATLAILTSASIYMAGCSNKESNNSAKNNTSVSSSTDSDTQIDTDSFKSISKKDTDTTYSSDDPTISLDSLEDNTYKITTEGTYIFSGTIDDGQIVVDAEDSSYVHIVLAGVDITSKASSPIYVKQADKVVITLADDTTNTLTDSQNLVYEDSESKEPNATIFSKDDLTINGNGTLIINANFRNGIQCKDDLKLVGGNINITAANDAIKGKDSVTISDSSITVSCEDDGITSSAGYINIISGNIDITKSYEGIEAATINISGGDIKIVSSDDGLNAANSQGNGDSMAGDSSCSISISNANLYINADGDGIDSNGTIVINSGNIVVDGPSNSGNGAIDYGISMEVNGGELIAVGASGMAENASTATQPCALVTFDNMPANTTICVADSDGKIITTHTSAKSFNSLVVSSKELELGKTYNIYKGTSTEGDLLATWEQTDSIYGKGTGMGHFQGGGNRFQDDKNRPDMFDKEKPDKFDFNGERPQKPF